MGKPEQQRYSGYYTARVLWHKEKRWRDLQFGASCSRLTPPAEGGAFRRNHKIYVTVAGGTSRTEVSTEGAPHYEGRDIVGHVSFIPAERQNQGWYQGKLLECLSLEIPPEWFAHCLDGRNPSDIEFLPATNRFDPLIFNAMLALREEAETNGPAGQLFVDTTVNMIVLHLLRHYSSLCPLAYKRDRQEISWNVVKRAIEFMEENLSRDLRLDELARVANMSVSTFARAFQRTLRLSPHKFLIARRVQRARELLACSDIEITDIAYRLGFSSQSHFSTVFRLYVGESPAHFRQMIALNSRPSKLRRICNW